MISTSAILYQDASLLVLNKPAGLPVHPGTGGGPNLTQFLPALQLGAPTPPALAHRLDRDTSGCLMLGRDREALQRLERLLARGAITKTYWAVVQGVPLLEEGRINLPLGKQSPDKHRWWMMPHPDGQPAITDYRVLGTSNGQSWLELTPRTGRTHQLRVHCQALGCPIIGDKAYGIEGDYPGRPLMHLHARAINIPGQPPVQVTAPPPAHMLNMLLALGFDPHQHPGNATEAEKATNDRHQRVVV